MTSCTVLMDSDREWQQISWSKEYQLKQSENKGDGNRHLCTHIYDLN